MPRIRWRRPISVAIAVGALVAIAGTIGGDPELTAYAYCDKKEKN